MLPIRNGGTPLGNRSCSHRSLGRDWPVRSTTGPGRPTPKGDPMTIKTPTAVFAVLVISSLLAARADAQVVPRRGPWAVPPAVAAPAYYSSYYVPPYTYP